ncbi:WASH complex subunit 4 isoform X2 [Zootermopsis nevadensis]|uniref:WASH complex subunit 4 isoform X2 n=1 Tax=Zootermopsis nevadensis TaxID=136037 RepID=UPI000B8E2F51|nr:WASH complex subunit 4 isoform X2 [Zootermopsis nevadensis]
MLAGVEWDYNRLEDGTHKIAGEIQLRTYGQFLEEYGAQLKGIEEALEDSVCDSWDVSLNPISLQFVPYERTTLLQLIDTDNKVLNKILVVFATLCAEVRYLQSEAKDKYYDIILFYGEGGEGNLQDGAAQLLVSRMLPHLQELSCFVKRCEQVAVQIVEQLAALYSSSKDAPHIINATGIHFQDVFEHLGDILVILLTLDEVLGNHSTLHDHWIIYKRTLKSVHHDPSKFGVELEKLKNFENLLSKLENHLLTGKIFQKMVEQSFGGTKGFISKNISLAEEFNLYLRNAITVLEMKAVDLPDSEHLMLWVKLSALYVLNFNLFGTVDRKLFKQLWDLNKRIPAVTLVGNILWFPEQFLLTHLTHMAKLIDKKTQQIVQTRRQAYLQQKAQSLPKEVRTFCLQMETTLKRDSTVLKLEDLNQRCDLFLQGVQYACEISHLLKTVTNLHVTLAKPMTKTSVLALCKLVELLKGIQHMYLHHNMTIAKSINHVVQHLAFQALSIIVSAKKGVVQDKRYSEKHLDILSSLVLAEKVLYGPGTKERRLIACLALSTANQMRTFRDDEWAILVALLHKLDMMCDIQEKVASACDCSFFYWHRVILPTYFANLYESKVDLHRLAYMFCALRDCILAMERTKHNSSPQVLKDSFDREICGYLSEQVLQPLCHDIETNLRLHVHSHLQLDDRNPFRVGVMDFTPFLRLKPLRFFNRYIDIRGFVEHYLDQTFYNLTTVALHDWKTYGEMRNLAQHNFGLATVEDHLPSQTLEQGLDVLEIMRNIHIFVSKYLYNLNNQIFVEQSSNNKHLNTINIRHIANSIRTHGTGIMNTTVNFTYQFLRKKFFIFSQFMYDEHIKSRLIKDIRYFRENKTQLEQKYSYERADKFNKGIRKLGVTADGLSYLDQFRMLISHIGNAMGYVRMIRSGGLHCCSNAICFVPDLEDIVSFEDLCKEADLSNQCRSAAHRLDQVIGNLVRNFAEGTEYFKLLVDVFAPVFRDPKNMHLRNFHIIVPPLAINFVEHSITCKEKMSKKNKVGAAFTDDGFAMGIAYILKLLDQYEEFDSLHWFQSVRDKYNKDKASLGKHGSVVSKEDEKLQQTMTLTARRLDMYQHEFDLLYYSLSSARIFFQKENSTLEEENMKTEATSANSF